MPKTFENWLSLVKSCVYYAHQTCEIYQLLSYLVDLKIPLELWNPLSKTVLSKFSFIWNKGPVNIWNDRNLLIKLVNIFFQFLTLHSVFSLNVIS